jgi:hypothetical protein
MRPQARLSLRKLVPGLEALDFFNHNTELRIQNPRDHMSFESDKIMFEIYRETTYSGKYRVVYFTELQDHNKEVEIGRAMAGKHVFDGFIRTYRKDQAKEVIGKLLARLNAGEAVGSTQIELALKPFMPS